MPAKPRPITLSQEDQQELEQRASSLKMEQRMVLRAKIVLQSAAGKSNRAIAEGLQIGEHTVGKWRGRFAQEGLEGLEDAEGRGRKPGLAPEKVRQVLDQAVTKPPGGIGRWSCRTMGQQVGVSKASVQRLWRKAGIKPHLKRTFKLSNDPNFEDKYWDVVGLYLNPPANAIVLSCDEKSQIQALERTQPGLPLGIGHIATETHDYYRHGTVTLFAALEYLSGKVIAQTAARHRHQEWLAFLKKIDSETSPELDLHLICDNYATHKHAKVKAWLKRHPRFKVHFTPTSASWLNLVERFFRDITQNAIRCGSFNNVPFLVSSIFQYINHHNLAPKRYVWHADPHVVLDKINRAWEALCSEAYNAKQQNDMNSFSETLH